MAEPNASIRLWQGDITALSVDVIVNAANKSLQGGGGVDGAIHRIAGRALKEECRTRYPDGGFTGGAFVTAGHRLKAGWVIHTVGPYWRGGDRGEPDLLADCYRNSLQATADLNARTVAFPCISTGIYDYPNEEAALIAVHTVREFLREPGHGIEEVVFVVFSSQMMALYQRLLETE
jgi:O-acetyl-ADP-ribose deacetylase (regulator of RNase III)